MLARNTCKVYLRKLDQMNGAYYRYCKGVVHADSVLVEKIRNTNFVDLVRDPPIPDRRPDLITFVHKPFEVRRDDANNAPVGYNKYPRQVSAGVTESDPNVNEL